MSFAPLDSLAAAILTTLSTSSVSLYLIKRSSNSGQATTADEPFPGLKAWMDGYLGLRNDKARGCLGLHGKERIGRRIAGWIAVEVDFHPFGLRERAHG